MGCIYCEDSSVAFAGHLGSNPPGLCDEHGRRHRIHARLFESVIGRMTPTRQPRWRYFEHNGWRYCWTTERMDDGKFAAFIYKPDGDDLVLVKELRFAKRQTAKGKALHWWDLARSRASGRLPASALR